MKEVMHAILKYLWIIREFEDAKTNKYWIFNYWNPFAWVALICFAIIMGALEGLILAFKVVRQEVSDSIKTRKRP